MNGCRPSEPIAKVTMKASEHANDVPSLGHL
ncbi:hypothetical protein GQ600_763 [Phytophthora cactorum]|nr:hypothetical protein GQ600_763 [Phytophthora cactorum]